MGLINDACKYSSKHIHTCAHRAMQRFSDSEVWVIYRKVEKQQQQQQQTWINFTGKDRTGFFFFP